MPWKKPVSGLTRGWDRFPDKDMRKANESRAHPDSIQSGRALSMLARNGGLLCPAGTALRYRDAAAGTGGGPFSEMGG
jgi:hypothetical protein